MERVRTGLRIPIGLNTELILCAREQYISKNALILKILRDWIAENGRKPGSNPGEGKEAV